MIREFQKFSGNKVLGWLLMHPSTPISISELGRVLMISPATVSHYTSLLEESRIVSRTTSGTAHLVRLSQESPLVPHLKKAYAFLLLWDAGIHTIAPGAISVVLYGSFASGTFDEKSDIDILVLGEEKDVCRDLLLDLQERMGMPVQLAVMAWHRFEMQKEKNDPFIQEIRRNHLLVAGSPL